MPGIQRAIDLQQFVPRHFHNAWVVVAVALVATTVIKGICDYVGTYLVNYAGFGMITDLRNQLYSCDPAPVSQAFFPGTPPAPWFPP